MKKNPIAFPFVVEQLDRMNPAVRPMFGCHALYVGPKIVLILRKKNDGDPDNGVWVSITDESQDELKKQFPSMRNIKIFEPSKSSWQNIPESAADFEESVLKICDLILRNDQRIGKIPKQKKKKVSSSKR